MENHTANVQYNDYKGTIAADRSDDVRILEILEQKGLISDTERLIGVKLHRSEVSTSGSGLISINAYKIDIAGSKDIQSHVQNTSEPKVTKVELDISLEEFMNLFKRLELVLIQKDLDGLDIELPK